METIEVRYRPIAPGIYHKYIVYTDSNGQKTAARGGPQYPLGSPSSTPSAPFGDIDTKWGPYDPSFGKDYAPEGTHPSETIATGDNLSSEWEKIKEAMDDIKNQKIPYEPNARNSNTTVDESLRRAGLPEPQLDDIGENWSPASGRDISPASDEPSPWGGDFFGPSEDELDIPPSISDDIAGAENFIRRRDPLTFDLDGDGIETIGIDPNNPILFDHDGDGLKTATGWISADDAFLVLDRNSNGTIDNGTELFGDSTPLNGGANAADGFAALTDQDSNHDGKVDSNDANFARLRLWQDLNQDGISQAGELFTLNQKGIVSITVAKTENNTLLPDGNVLADVGSYTRTDGTVGGIGDIGHLGDVDLTSTSIPWTHRQSGENAKRLAAYSLT